LPNTAAQKRDWDAGCCTAIQKVDLTAQNLLTRWISETVEVIGSPLTVVQRFHQRDRGLTLLDRYLGSLIGCKTNLQHKIFGARFKSYIEYCQQQDESPKGRVMLALISLRFRVDRERGRTIQVIHLYNIPLQGHRMQEVQTFVDRVNAILSALDPSEIKDRSMMYEWLWQKFKNWPPISTKAEKIRDSRVTSHKRTWDYLWKAINDKLTNVHEDENFDSIHKGIKDGTLFGAPAPKKETPKKDAWGPSAENVPGAPGQPGAHKRKWPGAAKTEGKGDHKGKEGKSKGKDGKGKGKDKGKGKSKGDKASKGAGKSGKEQLTLEQKSKIACKYHVMGTCTRGDACPWSHNKAICEKAKKSGNYQLPAAPGLTTEGTDGKAGKAKPAGPHPKVGAGVASVAAGLANLASG